MKQDITSGTVWKQILLFFFPILFGTFFQQLYNTVDAALVGQFVGKEALSAVGGAPAIIITLIIGLFTGISSGATVSIAQFFGAKAHKSVSDATHTAIAVSLIGAVILTIVGYFSASYVLNLCRTPEDVFEESLIYIEIYYLGLIWTFLYNMGSSILRAIGDSKRPFYFLIIGCILNIILDIIFLVPLHMGVAGAAIATLISQAVSAILTLACLIRTNESCKLYLKKITIKKDHLARIMKIGIPIGIQSATYNLANLLIQSSINDFGTDTIAAWGAYWKMDVFWMVMSAFSIALTTFVGQNYGAGLYERIRKGVRSTLWMAHLTSIVICGVYILFAEFLFSLFSSDAAVIETGVRMLYFLMPTYITYVCTEVLSGALRAMGDTFMPMLLSCGGVCAIRVIWTGFIYPMNPTIEMLELNYPVSWIITSVLFVIYYLWKRKKLMPDL